MASRERRHANDANDDVLDDRVTEGAIILCFILAFIYAVEATAGDASSCDNRACNGLIFYYLINIIRLIPFCEKIA